MFFYRSGTCCSNMIDGTQSHWPVIGGLSSSSSNNAVQTAAFVPPGEMPPTRKPLVGSALSSDACVATH